MNQRIEFTPYSPNWPKIYASIAAEVTGTLGDNLLAIHHIGSTSVPGLAAKPTIDIIAEVRNGMQTIQPLEQLDFQYKGEYNLPMRFLFVYRGLRFDNAKVNLHIFEENNPEIELNILLRDYLRNNDRARDEYAKLKTNLAGVYTKTKHQGSILNNYTLGKDEFIRKTLAKLGFKRDRLLLCAHYVEWNEYHRIREQQIFTPINVVYNRHHPDLTAADHFHFIFCHGLEIVSVAHVEFIDTNIAALRSLATDDPYKHQGFAARMMALLEKWTKRHGRSVIKLHAALRAEGFYRKLGYVEMEFRDKSISDNIVDLGKIL